MYELERLTAGHLEAALAFEVANRAYFARSISDPGDRFFQTFAERHHALLAEQEAGFCVYSVLVADDESVVGRFNLRDLDGGTARVGYRVAEHVAGQGVATSALRELCRRAAVEYGLTVLTAEASNANPASRRVLEKVGFSPVGSCTVGGQPGTSFSLTLPVRAV